MADNTELLLEAERRGILPPDKVAMLAEARQRGLIPPGEQRPLADMPPQAQQNTWGQAIKNVGEAGLRLGTGIVGSTIGNAAGLAAIPMNALGLTDADPSAVQEQVSNALTYQPSNPASATNEAIDFVGSLPERGGTFLANETGAEQVPYLGNLVRKAPEIGLNVLGLKGAKALKVPEAEPSIPKTVVDVQKSQVKEALDAGYAIQPRQVPGAVIGDAVEGMTNSAKLERTLSKKNQAVTNGIARKEAGLKGDGPISQAQLDDARLPYFEVYDKVGKSGRIVADEQFARDMFNVGKETDQLIADFPEAASRKMIKLRNAYLEPEFDAASAVRATRQLRKDAKQYFKAFDDPEKQALGHAAREISDALEGALERHLASQGSPKLMSQFRDARKSLAKINNIDEALSEASGNVDASYFGKLLDRGVPLTDGLRTLANVSKRFGRAVQLPEKLPTSGAGVLDLGAGAGAGFIGGPLAGVATLGVPFAARQALASRVYQSGLLGRKPNAAVPAGSLAIAGTPGDE